MNHLHIALLLLSGCAGMAVLTGFYLMFLFQRSERVRLFLVLQAFVVAIVGLNLLQSYTLVALGADSRIQILYYLLGAAWTPGYLYAFAVLELNLAGQQNSRLWKNCFLALSIAVSAASFVPLFFNQDLEKTRADLRWLDGHLLSQYIAVVLIAYSVHLFLRTRGEGRRNYLPVSVSFLILNSATTAPFFLSLFIGPESATSRPDLYLEVTDYYYLFWNLLCLAILFRLLPGMIGGRQKSSAAGKSAASRPDAAMMDDWRTIEAAISGKGLFRAPGLDLPAVARVSGLSRNRISLVVNQVNGTSFSDYINKLRIEEFKKIVVSPDFSGNILDAALSAGFNSKATFYNRIKSETEENPADYVRRLRKVQFL